MFGIISMLLIASTLFNQPMLATSRTDKNPQSLSLSEYNSQEPSANEGMMNEIVITAERPSVTELNNIKNKQKFTDYLTLIANVLIIVVIIGFIVDKLLSKWKRRKNIKREKGPFSLPPFSNKDIKIGKDYTCQLGV